MQIPTLVARRSPGTRLTLAGADFDAQSRAALQQLIDFPSTRVVRVAAASSSVAIPSRYALTDSNQGCLRLLVSPHSHMCSTSIAAFVNAELADSWRRWRRRCYCARGVHGILHSPASFPGVVIGHTGAKGFQCTVTEEVGRIFVDPARNFFSQQNVPLRVETTPIHRFTHCTHHVANVAAAVSAASALLPQQSNGRSILVGDVFSGIETGCDNDSVVFSSKGGSPPQHLFVASELEPMSFSRAFVDLSVFRPREQRDVLRGIVRLVARHGAVHALAEAAQLWEALPILNDGVKVLGFGPLPPATSTAVPNSLVYALLLVE